MYTNLSFMDVLPADQLAEKADIAEAVVSAMETGKLEFIESLWYEYNQYLRDCRTWSMQQAEIYGWTNQCSAAMQFP